MSEKACETIFINGTLISQEGFILNHNDRIKIGNSILIFKHPAQW